ncbi:transglycosylase SLT domain-containing protein [Nocardioides sp. GCM10027113]|uniref:transglycosylase SLT domain-containing protein n=1 Tax=unclassified Nocardioides TaxID=2615069 RepID=UPI003610037E
MSVTDVTTRIQQIQAQLAMLPSQPATSRVTAASGTQFANALGRAGAPGVTGPGGVTGDQVVAEARKYLGLPYVWGGTDPQRGMDCSGLVQVVYGNLGIDLPRVSYQQAQQGTPVASLAEAKPGDLVAWDNSSRNNGADHIGIYIGNGQMIEAPRPGTTIRVTTITDPPDYIRRILPDSGVGGPGAVSSATGRLAPGTPYAGLFTQAEQRYGVDAGLLAAIAKQESGFNPGAVSHAGAQGLMQLMPATARGLGVTDSFDPAQAVDGAARLMRDLLSRFGQTDLALAAYNAGPGAVLRYDGIPPYPETQNYVRSVLALWEAA